MSENRFVAMAIPKDGGQLPTKVKSFSEDTTLKEVWGWFNWIIVNGEPIKDVCSLVIDKERD